MEEMGECQEEQLHTLELLTLSIQVRAIDIYNTDFLFYTFPYPTEN